MHIIVVSDRMATAKTVTLTRLHVTLLVAVFVAAVLGVSSLLWFMAGRSGEDLRLPMVHEVALGVRAEEAQKTQELTREHLNVMAVKLGQMQAELLRLDSLGERLGKLVGVKSSDFKALDKQPKGGQGGPFVAASTPISSGELERALDELSREVQTRSEYLDLIENEILEERLRAARLPTVMPVNTNWTSGFGVRSDPFTHQRAVHEGLDFPAPSGTPIVAAAAGVVINAEYHPQYGNMVEVDHGHDLVTRYAHASRITVRPGAVVNRGQKIAEVGSTGRSTGSHLHFEVRVAGVARNPVKFLEPGGAAQMAQRR